MSDRPVNDLPAGTPRGLEVLKRERVYQGFFDLEILELRHERFDGGWTPPLRRQLLKSRRSVSVLPYDPVADAILLVEQFRVGSIDGPESDWILEAPAGLLDAPDEPLEQAARRELLEETGLAARQIEQATLVWTSPGISAELQALFVAAVTLPAHGGLFGLAHENEDIRTHVLPVEQAFTALDGLCITGVTAVLGLLWLRHHRPRLRREWAPTEA